MDEMFHPPSRHRWYLLQTKPLCESKVFANLQRRQYETIFLQIGCGPNGQNAEPLFPRYLLARLESPTAMTVVREMDGVTRFLKMNNEIVSVQDGLVSALSSAALSGKIVTAEFWMSLCSHMGLTQDMSVEHGSARRALQLVELVCQAESKSPVTSPLRRAA